MTPCEEDFQATRLAEREYPRYLREGDPARSLLDRTPILPVIALHEPTEMSKQAHLRLPPTLLLILLLGCQATRPASQEGFFDRAASLLVSLPEDPVPLVHEPCDAIRELAERGDAIGYFEHLNAPRAVPLLEQRRIADADPLWMVWHENLLRGLDQADGARKKRELLARWAAELDEDLLPHQATARRVLLANKVWQFRRALNSPELPTPRGSSKRVVAWTQEKRALERELARVHEEFESVHPKDNRLDNELPLSLATLGWNHFRRGAMKTLFLRKGSEVNRHFTTDAIEAEASRLHAAEVERVRSLVSKASQRPLRSVEDRERREALNSLVEELTQLDHLIAGGSRGEAERLAEERLAVMLDLFLPPPAGGDRDRSEEIAMLSARGYWDQAEVLAEQSLLRRQPTIAELYQVANVSNNLGRLSESVGRYARVVKRCRVEGGHEFYLAASLIKLGLKEEAESIVSSLEEQSLARAALEVSMSQSASSQLALLDARTLSDAHNLPFVLLLVTGSMDRDPEETLRFLRTVVERVPEPALLHAGIATILQGEGRFPESLEAARVAAALDPKSLQLQLILARSLHGVGDNKSALELTKFGVDRLLRSPKVLSLHAIILDDLGNQLGAQTFYGLSLELEPLDLMSRNNLARIHYAAGRYGQAVRTLRPGLALHPNSAPLRLSLARALKADGHWEEAVITVEAALEIDPEHAGCQELRAELLRKR